MPSSLIIVALAVAWLVVLVPMVARRRQEIARTGEDAMASRVLRRPGPRGYEREETVMAEQDYERDEETEVAEYVEDEPVAEVGETEDVEFAGEYEEDEYVDDRPARPRSRYRPGRGGFDPEAAEVAARAKYAFRQRVVVALLAAVVISVLLAAVVWSGLWWVTGVSAAGLAGYLGYLRRQVRIETEIRERRLARLAGARSAERRRHREEDFEAEFDREQDYEGEYEHEYELAGEEPMPIAGVERKPRPHSRQPRRNAVVVDVEDEDPAFYELDEPGPPAYRRAVGE